MAFDHSNDRRITRCNGWGCVLAMIVALLASASGCARLRLPAIDSTGSRIFAPLPTTTTLALPGTNGQGIGCLTPGGTGLGGALSSPCLAPLAGLKACLATPKFSFPEPAFVTPADPPPCPTPTCATTCTNGNEPCVPSAPCNGTCLTGPRAVLIGDEIGDCGDCLHGLPDRGKRGCILLSPQRVVAPVGSEVLFLSGVCGTDGYLQMNEPLEWMLTPDSVGTIIDVGDDHPGALGRLIGSSLRPEKRDPTYAIGVTGTQPMLITRGNNDPRDDVQLEKGQTWLSLSSPSEGVSRLTVLAPESECWDQRRKTATVYWVDARWLFPGPQVVPVGTNVDLTTRVTRSEGTLPARGWKVRYEILQPELASFAGTNGGSVVEAVVDDNGDATATLIPNPNNGGGTATVNMQVIRPGGDRDDLPSLTLGTGQTFVTWSAPGLAIRAGAPEVASYEQTYTAFVNVSNPGDQPATNVSVELLLPSGTRAVAADQIARVLPSAVTWDIGTLPPQTQIDLSVDLISKSAVRLGFVARGDGLAAEDVVRVDVFRPSLVLAVEPVDQRVEVGRPATFNIDVQNTSDLPLANPRLVIRGDDGMIHQSGVQEVADVKDGPLNAGETWRKEVVFTPTSPGQRCIVVEATADGGQRATDQACTLAINPIPDTPLLTSRIYGPQRVQVGQEAEVTFEILNEGRGPAENVRVDFTYDPQLQPFSATENADRSAMAQNIISWTVPRIEAGASEAFAIGVQAVTATPVARVRAIARAQDVGSTEQSQNIEITAGPVVPSPSDLGPDLPAPTPPPSIPSGPAPEPLTGGDVDNLPPPVATPQRTGRLQTIISTADGPVRVNEPIRYTVTVVNDTNLDDFDVDIQMPLPDGIRVERLVSRDVSLTEPMLVKNGQVFFPPVPNLDDGEEKTFDMVLSSNQPQTFKVEVYVRSRNFPLGYGRELTTVVVP